MARCGFAWTTATYTGVTVEHACQHPVPCTNARHYCHCGQEHSVTAGEPTGSWPEGMEFIRQAREALGMFAGAMPITPQQAWEEALDRMRMLTKETDADPRKT